MGDRYLPTRRRGGAQYDRRNQYGNSYDRRNRYDRDDRDERDERDRYHRNERDDRARRYSRSRSPPRDRPTNDRYNDRRSDGEFNVRGAADRIRFKLPQPEPKFTFRAQGPQAQFPPSEPPKPQARRTEGVGRDDNSRQQRRLPREGKQAGRRRGGFRPRGANTRNILHGHGGSTPEQLSGMSTDGQTRFMALESSDEEEGNDRDDDSENGLMDLTQDSDEENSDQGPRKRVKISSPVPQPKWSNPDPYTALPPTDAPTAHKKDVVQLIRKAKIESASNASSANAVKNNMDFISFNDASEEGEASGIDSAEAPSPQRPVGPSTETRTHLPNGKQVSDRIAAYVWPPSGIAQDDSDDSPPPAPPGLIMPTAEELRAQYAGSSKGGKRKREQQSKGLNDILSEWEAGDSYPAPWSSPMVLLTISSGLRLHKEICDFYEFVRPNPPEAEVRKAVLGRVKEAVRKLEGKDVQVKCFGSFASGLYLPTADMDLVALSPEFVRMGRARIFQTQGKMHKLRIFLINHGITDHDSVSVVFHAKVPIVKFVDKKTGIRVDISFENETGLNANATFERWKEEYPAMPPLVMLIKQLLTMRGLNEVFTGGLGGFSIICLVVSMMQMMPRTQADQMDPEEYYGKLLCEFLNLYGNNFDITKTGITMNPSGYFDKVKNPAPQQNRHHLTIIDPNNPNNDISGGSRNIDQVLDCFRSAYAAIQRRLTEIDSGKDVKGSILECVVGGDYSSYMDMRNRLGIIHGGGEVSPLPVPAPKQRKPHKPRRALSPRRRDERPGPPHQENYKSVPPPAHLQQNTQHKHKHTDVQLMPPQQNTSAKPQQTQAIDVQREEEEEAAKMAKVRDAAARTNKRIGLGLPFDAAPFHDTIELHDYPQHVLRAVIKHATLSEVHTSTGASLTQKGSFKGGDLRILVEGTTDGIVQDAMKRLRDTVVQALKDPND